MPARMRKRGFFSDLIAAAVKEALVDVEQNAYDAIEEIGRTVRPGWRVVDVISGAVKVDAQPWDMIVDSGDYASVLTVLIPAATKHNRGVEIAVCRMGTRVVYVRPVSGLIDGVAADMTMTSPLGRVYVSTGSEWVHRA